MPLRSQCHECGAWVRFGNPREEYQDHNDGCPVLERLEALESYDLSSSG